MKPFFEGPDKWGLPRPRAFLYCTIFSLFYIDGKGNDIRHITTRWLHMWYNIGVMRYYDSAWEDDEGLQPSSAD